MTSLLLEIACFDVESALLAESAGVHRLEFCSNYAEGGVTASHGALRLVREKITIPVFPMIRPRGGNFFYTATEFMLMQQDIIFCKSLGFEGVVLGLLYQNGSIDETRTARLVDLAYPMEVTFHRAFDRCREPFAALAGIIGCGCQRILTSGLQASAEKGTGLIKELVDAAGEKLVIMPGGGIRSSNISGIAKATAAKEFHSSALGEASDLPEISLPSEGKLPIPDPGEVRKMLTLLGNFR